MICRPASVQSTGRALLRPWLLPPGRTQHPEYIPGKNGWVQSTAKPVVASPDLEDVRLAYDARPEPELQQRAQSVYQPSTAAAFAKTRAADTGLNPRLSPRVPERALVYDAGFVLAMVYWAWPAPHRGRKTPPVRDR